MKTRTLVLIAVVCTGSATALPVQAQNKARRLVSIEAPEHDPLFLDAASLTRSGTTASFKYLLDVAAPADEHSKPSIWKSNEIEATIDCRRRTVTVRRLVAYSGPRGTGTAMAVHSFTAPGLKPEPIMPRSTFAYLETHVCRGG